MLQISTSFRNLITLIERVEIPWGEILEATFNECFLIAKRSARTILSCFNI